MAKDAAAMNSEREIYAVANTYIREHGEDAVIQAAMHADTMLDAGDMEGQLVWLLVIEAIRVLSAMTPTERVTHLYCSRFCYIRN